MRKEILGSFFMFSIYVTRKCSSSQAMERNSFFSEVAPEKTVDDFALFLVKKHYLLVRDKDILTKKRNKNFPSNISGIIKIAKTSTNENNHNGFEKFIVYKKLVLDFAMSTKDVMLLPHLKSNKIFQKLVVSQIVIHVFFTTTFCVQSNRVGET